MEKRNGIRSRLKRILQSPADMTSPSNMLLFWNIDKRLDDYMDSEEHVLNVRESRMDYLRLGLDEEKFVNALNANALVGV